MTKNIVILDTSVLIGCSVFIPSRIIGSKEPLKDFFYDKAIKLHSFLEKNVSERIGIYTRTTEIETFNALQSAVERCLDKGGYYSEDNVSFGVNFCSDQLSRITSILIREPIDTNRCDKLFVEVANFYSLQFERSILMDRQLVENRAKIIAEGRAPRQYRQFVEETALNEEQQKWFQLTEFKRNRPAHRDHQILSEAIYLKEIYQKSFGEVKVWLASVDTGHFSPKRFESGIISDQITSAIKEKFGIECEWPDVITEKLSSAKS